MTEKDIVRVTVDDWCRDFGLQRKSTSWYGENGEVISVTNLQKSQHSSRYYLNQGFWLSELGSERYPRDTACHIRFRVGSLPGIDAAELDRLLNPDEAIPDDARAAVLTNLLGNQLVPVIRQGASVAGLRYMFAHGIFKAAGIRGPAQAILKGS